jgi:hypothetical protein
MITAPAGPQIVRPGYIGAGCFTPPGAGDAPR